MKPTIKVSISGCAFNLEEDAYKTLSDYLEQLKDHFSNNSESAEIISDVENRISELLTLRLTADNKAVSLEDVQYIINIMGSPKDFGNSDEMSASKNEEGSEPVKLSFRKRLYRDMDNSILGGVCSGFARYINTDPVLVRIVYILSIFGTGFLYNRLRFYLIALYFLLWIVMPKAKTVAQKLSMRGANPSIEDIENREYTSINQTRGSGLLKVLKILFGVILGLIAFSSIMSIVAILGVYFGFSFGGTFLGLSYVLDVLGLGSTDFKISMLILMLLPLLMIIYTSFKLMLQRRFKVRDVVIYGVAFLLWIGVACYMGTVSWKYGKMYEHREVAIENVTSGIRVDTLHVQLGDKYIHAKAFECGNIPDLKMLRINEENQSFFFIPEIIVKEDASAIAFNVEVKKYAFGETEKLAQDKAQNAAFDYTIRDSLLIINPHIYNKHNIWDREWFEIEITVPSGKGVLIDAYQYKYSVF